MTTPDNLRLIVTILLLVTGLASLVYNLRVERSIKKIKAERLKLPDLMKVHFQKSQEVMPFDAVADVDVDAVARRGDVILIRCEHDLTIDQHKKIKESLDRLGTAAGVEFIYLGCNFVVESIVRLSDSHIDRDNSANDSDHFPGAA